MAIHPPASQRSKPPATDVPIPPGLARASPKRLTEFIAGRRCAAEALRRLGWNDPPPVGIAGDRSPVWPAGVVGSITHTESFAWAAVADAARLRGIGVDSEAVVTQEEAIRVRRLIVSEAEWERLPGGASGAQPGPAALVTFALSAKESVYKCLHPLCGRFLDFGDVEIVELDVEAGRFAVRLLRPALPALPEGAVLSGRLALSPPLLHTAVELAPASPDA
jgi:enterobactin synthetase component D